LGVVRRWWLVGKGRGASHARGEEQKWRLKKGTAHTSRGEVGCLEWWGGSCEKRENTVLAKREGFKDRGEIPRGHNKLRGGGALKKLPRVLWQKSRFGGCGRRRICPGGGNLAIGSGKNGKVVSFRGGRPRPRSGGGLGMKGQREVMIWLITFVGSG